MAKAKSRKTTKRRRVTFTVKASEAKQVSLLGDFNNWNPKIHPMISDGSGTWNKTVMLTPGQYEYKFLIDGSWQEDPQNEHTCANCFGTVNSVYNLSHP